MEKILVTFLGTGNAVPTEKRNHTAILISYKNENVLVDCGEGTQRQFRIAGRSPHKLTRILITHWHGDHILGLPGLFQTLALTEYSKSLGVYGPKNTRYFMGLIEKLTAHKIKLYIKEISSGKVFENSEIKIESLQMNHGTSTLAYSFIVKDKMRLDKRKIRKLKLPNSPLLKKLQEGKDVVVNGRKIRSKEVCYLEKGRKVTIILDTKINSQAIKIAKDSDLLICESTFSSSEEKLALEYKHLTAKQAAEIAKKSKSKKLVLTHISQRYENDIKRIENEAKSIFKNVSVVKDFEKIEV